MQRSLHTLKERSEFVTTATLLSLIDPVRGDPTHTLDRGLDDPAQRLNEMQKRFLDSFALICSTSRKGAETASAVCIDGNSNSDATTLRVARNKGLPTNLRDRLQSVLEYLKRIAHQGSCTPDMEKRMLLDIITITNDKITSLLEWLHKTYDRQAVDPAIAALVHGTKPNFQRWIRNLPHLVSLGPDLTPHSLLPHIEWASRARWDYSQELESFLFSALGEVPSWVSTLYKLGRYYAAVKAMIKLATKKPRFFYVMTVEAVTCPMPQEKFEVRQKDPLFQLLQGLSKTVDTRLGTSLDPGHIVSELNRTCFAPDSCGRRQKNPEEYFRRKCCHTLTLHAEMQLLYFYDQYPQLSPWPRLMGTSKKACYLCHQFLSEHRLHMVVSACHQKLYPSWMPPEPPPGSEELTQKYRSILWVLRLKMEEALKEELKGQLGRRRPANMDSTAGPPITFTNSVWTMHLSDGQGGWQSRF